MQRALFLSGWYVRRGLTLRERVHGSPQAMAEVDVLALGFDPLLTPKSMVGEWKDRTGSTKEADRIVWLLGLAKLLRVDHVLFAKTTISPATVQFAKPAGVLHAIRQRYVISSSGTSSFRMLVFLAPGT